MVRSRSMRILVALALILFMSSVKRAFAHPAAAVAQGTGTQETTGTQEGSQLDMDDREMDSNDDMDDEDEDDVMDVDAADAQHEDVDGDNDRQDDELDDHADSPDTDSTPPTA